MSQAPSVARLLRQYGVEVSQETHNGLASLSCRGLSQLSDDQRRDLAQKLGSQTTSVWLVDAESGSRLITGRRFAPEITIRWLETL